MKNNLIAQVNISQNFGENFQGNPPSTVGDVISRIIPTIYTISLVAVVLYFIWGSYRYLMSGGDPKAVASAKQTLTWAVAGMLIVFMSYWIFQLVNSLVFNTYGP